MRIRVGRQRADEEADDDGYFCDIETFVSYLGLGLATVIRRCVRGFIRRNDVLAPTHTEDVLLAPTCVALVTLSLERRQRAVISARKIMAVDLHETSRTRATMR